MKSTQTWLIFPTADILFERQWFTNFEYSIRNSTREDRRNHDRNFKNPTIHGRKSPPFPFLLLLNWQRSFKQEVPECHSPLIITDDMRGHSKICIGLPISHLPTIQAIAFGTTVRAKCIMKFNPINHCIEFRTGIMDDSTILLAF